MSTLFVVYFTAVGIFLAWWLMRDQAPTRAPFLLPGDNPMAFFLPEQHRCKSCHQRTSATIYGECHDCYYADFGYELEDWAESNDDWVFESYDDVYEHADGPLYVSQTDEEDFSLSVYKFRSQALWMCEKCGETADRLFPSDGKRICEKCIPVATLKFQCHECEGVFPFEQGTAVDTDTGFTYHLCNQCHTEAEKPVAWDSYTAGYHNCAKCNEPGRNHFKVGEKYVCQHCLAEELDDTFYRSMGV